MQSTVLCFGDINHPIWNSILRILYPLTQVYFFFIGIAALCLLVHLLLPVFLTKISLMKTETVFCAIKCILDI